ncbi:MAG: hypothetical protein ACHQYP_04575, partial [Nitrospiria bacterium]
MVRKIKKRTRERNREIEGKLQTHPEGFGFVLSEIAGQPDVYISRYKMMDAMHGDRVLIRIEGKNKRGKP